jgi:hypothetical protein
LTFSQDGVDEMSHSNIHLTTHLFPSQSCVPFADRSFVHVKGNYVAPLVFIDKPAGWADKESELGYLWQLFARDAIFDTECFCQLTRANDAIIRDNMSRVTRQTIAAQNLSTKNASVDVGASIRQQKAIAAQSDLYEGALPLNLAVVFLIHRKDVESLDSACRYLQNCFRRPAWIDWEKEYAWKIWLQTLPTAWEKLLSTPFDRRLTYLSGEAPGFMSLVQSSPVDKQGLELVTDEGGVPLFLDVYSQHRNLALFATTRAGKSVLVAGILSQGLARGVPTIVMDFPPSDAASTFKDFTHYVGGAYFDIGKESNNLLEVPDLSSFDPKDREERMVDFKDFVGSALMIMVFGAGDATTTADRMLKQAIRAVLIPAIDNFFDDPQMVQRYADGHQAGVGSDAWGLMPTLNDFMQYFEENGLKGLPQSVLSDPNTAQAINQIKRQLRFWVSSRVGKAIARPSTFRTDSMLLVFALRGLSDGDDASILALSAYSAVLRRTLSHKESICFIDEFSVLLEWNQIGALVARLTANGAKAGIRVILAAQDPNTLINSPSGPKIIQNISTRLIGRIQPVAQQSFIDGLQVAPTIIARNAGKNFYPAKEGLYSQWLLDEQSTYTYVRYYSPPVLLAVIANNPHEAAARQAFMKAYNNDPYEALSAFADELTASFREGRSIRVPNGEQFIEPLELPETPVAEESVIEESVIEESLEAVA